MPRLNDPDIVKQFIPAGADVVVSDRELRRLQASIKVHRSVSIQRLENQMHVVVEGIQPGELDPSPLLSNIALKEHPNYLGGGGFGLVFKAVYFGATVAVKKLKLTSAATGGFATSEQLQQFLNEVEIMKSWPHPNIIPLLGAVMQRDCCCLVMEYVPMTVYAKLKQTYNALPSGLLETIPAGVVGQAAPTLEGAKAMEEMFPLELRLQLLKGVLAGLQFLHSKKVAHRDLKTSNILLSNDWVCRLIDFGMSRLMKKLKSSRHKSIRHTVGSDDAKLSGAGTVAYMPPEMLMTPQQLHDLYGSDGKVKLDAFACDIWALGMIIYEFLFALSPFGELSAPDSVLSTFIINGRRPALPAYVKSAPASMVAKLAPEWLLDVMQRCWQRSPSERPQLVEIIALFKKNCSADIKLPRDAPAEHGVCCALLFLCCACCVLEFRPPLHST